MKYYYSTLFGVKTICKLVGESISAYGLLKPGSGHASTTTIVWHR